MLFQKYPLDNYLVPWYVLRKKKNKKEVVVGSFNYAGSSARTRAIDNVR